MVLSLFLIGAISERVIQYVVLLSKAFNLSGMAAGFILLSITTSLPELSVSILAAFAGEGGLALGNVLGSNIANLTIITGLAILISKTEISVEGEVQKELVHFLFLSSVIPLFVVQRGSLSPVLGIVLLILFIYFGVTIGRKTETEIVDSTEKNDTAVIGLKLTGSVALIVALSKLLVDSSLEIAEIAGLPPSIIGATIVGLGTSFPELVTTIQALRSKLFDMALGNLLGSCITNITLILGASSLVSPSPVDVLAVGSILFYVLGSSLSVWYMVDSSRRISKKGALFLCGLYLLFTLQQIGISIFIF